MRRKTFDTLISVAGLLIAVVLLVAGGLLLWSSIFINNQVHDQLAAQKITFPASDSPAVQGAEFAPMRQYGGQQMTTGAQAQVYAENFIRVHMGEIAGGKTYSEVSALAQADPTNLALKGQADALFKGNALRGLLLNAYAFWKVGQIAMIAAIVAFGASALMLILSGLGLWHARRTSAEVELGSPTPVPVAI